LIESARTNYLLNSYLFTTGWSVGGATISANATIAPDGSNNAQKVIQNSSLTLHSLQAAKSTISNNVPVTFSVFAKYNGTQYLKLNIDDGSANGVVGSFDIINGNTSANLGVNGDAKVIYQQITPYANGWYRCSVTGVASTTTANIRSSIILSDNVSGNQSSWYPSIQGDGVSGFYIWGAQLETSNDVSSYISTTSSQVTRASDLATINISNYPSWYNSTQGTFLVEAYTDATYNNSMRSIIQLIQSTNTSNYISMGIQTNVPTQNRSSNYVRLQVNGASPVGKLIDISGSSGSFKSNTYNKFAFTYQYNSNTVSVCASNSAIVTNTTSLYNYSSFDTLRIGDTSDDLNINGYVKYIYYYPLSLSNSQIQALTQKPY
jgi:hypothetical protein